jgi:hypothetical protein
MTEENELATELPDKSFTGVYSFGTLQKLHPEMLKKGSFLPEMSICCYFQLE